MRAHGRGLLGRLSRERSRIAEHHTSQPILFVRPASRPRRREPRRPRCGRLGGRSSSTDATACLWHRRAPARSGDARSRCQESARRKQDLYSLWHFRSTGPYNRLIDDPHDCARAGARAHGRPPRRGLPLRVARRRHPSQAAHPGVRWDGSESGPAVDEGGPAPEPLEARIHQAAFDRSRRRTLPSRRRRGRRLPPASIPASTTSTTSSCAIRRPTFPISGMVRREPARFLFGYVPIAKPKLFSIRGGTSFWVTAGQAGVRSSILTVPVTFPPEDVPNGELPVGAAAARHPRHDGHLLVLRDRPEPLRGGQHRVRRHPQAAGDGGRRRPNRARRPAESDRAVSRSRRSAARRRRSTTRTAQQRRRAPGAGRTSACR